MYRGIGYIGYIGCIGGSTDGNKWVDCGGMPPITDYRLSDYRSPITRYPITPYYLFLEYEINSEDQEGEPDQVVRTECFSLEKDEGEDHKHGQGNDFLKHL